jgi:hypothetical protein
MTTTTAAAIGDDYLSLARRITTGSRITGNGANLRWLYTLDIDGAERHTYATYEIATMVRHAMIEAACWAVLNVD